MGSDMAYGDDDANDDTRYEGNGSDGHADDRGEGDDGTRDGGIRDDSHRGSHDVHDGSSDKYKDACGLAAAKYGSFEPEPDLVEPAGTDRGQSYFLDRVFFPVSLISPPFEYTPLICGEKKKGTYPYRLGL